MHELVEFAKYGKLSCGKRFSLSLKGERNHAVCLLHRPYHIVKKVKLVSFT